MMTRKQKTRLKWILAEFFAIALAAFYIYPIFLMVNNSLKPFREVIMDVIALPSRLAVENYVNVVERMNYGALFMNNVIITVVALLGIIVFSSIAAYTINRTRNRYTRIAHFLIITPMLIPFQTFMITLLKTMNVFGLAGSLVGLGIQYWGFGVPMATFIYANFIQTVPREIDESAFIDGASTLQTFVHVIFPILKPITTTVVVLNVMWIWNDFLLPLLMVNSTERTRTLVLSAYTFVGQFNTQWHYAMTAMVLAVAPSVIFFVLLQKHIVKGVIAGAVKG